MLRNIWTAGLLLFAAVMASTFFINTVFQVSPGCPAAVDDESVRLLLQLHLLAFVGLSLVGCKLGRSVLSHANHPTVRLREASLIERGVLIDEWATTVSIIMEVSLRNPVNDPPTILMRASF